MPGWSKLVAGAVIGVAGTIYATNENVRNRLPEAARDLPDNLRRRFESAVAAAREATAERRAEILRGLEEHGGREHASRSVKPDPDTDVGISETPEEATPYEEDRGES